MKKITAVILCVLLTIGLCACGGSSKNNSKTIQKQLSLDNNTGEFIVDNGKSDYVIVIGESYDSAEYFAATELRSFIEQASGCLLPLMLDSAAEYSKDLKAISVGGTSLLKEAGLYFSFSGVKDDSFYYITEGKTIFITGANQRGTIFGVYEFLEKIVGVRFVTSDFTFVPELDKIPLYDTSALVEPSFEIRNVLSGEAYFADPLFNLRCRTVHEFAQMPAEYGGNIEWYRDIGTVHNSIEYVPRSKYAAYPELYYFEGNTALDICFTNGVTDSGEIDESMDISCIKIALASLKQFVLDAGPQDKYFLFGQMDYQTCCQCDRCVAAANKYKRGGIMVRFANILAREIQKWSDENLGGREINIITFAYLYSENAPVKTDSDGNILPIDDTVIAADNLIIRIAPLYANNNVSYLDADQSARYQSMMKEWSAVADNFFFWGYGTNYVCYFYYYPTLQAMKENSEIFTDMGVRYYMIQSSNAEKSDWQAKMLLYVGSKVMWNKDADIDALSREFIDLYYGPSAGFVSEFINLFNGHFNYLINNFNFTYNCFESEMYEYEFQPLRVLERGLEILDEGLTELEKKDLSEEQKTFYRRNLLEVQLTPLSMMLSNVTYYYTGDEAGAAKAVKRFFDTCSEVGAVKYNESLLIETVKFDYKQYF